MATGFFSYLKAVNRISTELLVLAKDYAIQFKNGDITSQEYESEMVGKIYELTNKYSGGEDDLEKDIKSKFSDTCVKYLKEGIELYVESLQQSNKTTTAVKDTVDNITPQQEQEQQTQIENNQEETQNQVGEKGIKPIQPNNNKEDVMSSTNVVMSENIKPSDMDYFMNNSVNQDIVYEIKKVGKDEVYIYKDKNEDNYILAKVTINWNLPYVDIYFEPEREYFLQGDEADNFIDKVMKCSEKEDIDTAKAIYKVIDLEGY